MTIEYEAFVADGTGHQVFVATAPEL